MAFSPFTGTSPMQSGVILTDAEIAEQARRQYEAQRVKQLAAYNRRLADQEAKQIAAAQSLVDQIAAGGGLSWDPIQRFAYGEVVDPDTVAPRALDPNADYAEFYTLDPNAAPEGRMWRGGGTQYGSIEGGANWIPTVDEARALLDAWAANPRMDLTPMTGTYQTPQDIVRIGLGEDIAPEWVNYFAAQTEFKNPVQGFQGDALRLGPSSATNFLQGVGPPNPDMRMTLQPVSDPLLYGRSNTLIPARGALDNLLAGTIDQQVGGNAFMKQHELQNLFNVEHQAPIDQWAQISAGLRRDSAERAQNEAIQNDAYQRYTLGNNYWGGVINDQYSQPFGGRLEGYDPNNPLAYFGWDGSRFGSSSGAAGLDFSQSGDGLWGMGGRSTGERFGSRSNAGSQPSWGGAWWGGPWGGGF